MFNINLRNIRLKQGLSQKQLAGYLNISPQSISKWERGEALPSIDFLPKLAECLNCEINDFFVHYNTNMFNIEMLKKFFDFMTEMVLDQTKKSKDFQPFLTEYPDILDVYKELGDSLKQYQTIKRKNIQEILNCSDVDTDIFIDYFVNHELIEKIDLEDSYFVLKSNIDGLRNVLYLAIEVCKLTPKDESN